MKTLITTLNAKYIHTALAIRLLYVASYPKHDVALKEYTIKQKNEDIVQDIHSRSMRWLSPLIFGMSSQSKISASN